MCGGIWFQILGPQTEKARFPNWVRVRTTKAALVVKERSWRRPDSAVLYNMSVASVRVVEFGNYNGKESEMHFLPPQCKKSQH